jgi:hypothetical protein
MGRPGVIAPLQRAMSGQWQHEGKPRSDTLGVRLRRYMHLTSYYTGCRPHTIGLPLTLLIYSHSTAIDVSEQGMFKPDGCGLCTGC